MILCSFEIKWQDFKTIYRDKLEKLLISRYSGHEQKIWFNDSDFDILYNTIYPSQIFDVSMASINFYSYSKSERYIYISMISSQSINEFMENNPELLQFQTNTNFVNL